MEEVGIESWDDVALLTNFVKAFKGWSDAHTERIAASEDVGKATLARLLFISHIGHVVILHGESSKVEEEIRLKGAFWSEICESRSCIINV